MKERQDGKVIRMRRHPSITAGLLCFVFVGYLLFLFVRTMTGNHVSIYEVNEKQMADSENLRGIILREEELVEAQSSGYINYYVADGARLSKTTTVYSVDGDGTVTSEVAALDTSDVSLSEEDTRSIREDIASFRTDFSLSDYSSITSFRYDVENTLLELSDVNLAKSLSQIREETGTEADFTLVKAEKTGILSYASDGLENLTLEDMTSDLFQEMKDSYKQLRTGSTIEAGNDVYRIVTSEKWSLVVQLDAAQYQKLSEKDTVTVTIKKDSRTATPAVHTFTSSGSYYASLVFDKYMVHYLNDRYLDIEIEFDSAEGLKIPVSSILTKECYLIPEEYMTTGDGTSSSDKGVAVISYDEDGSEQIDFVSAQIYYKDDEGNCYIDASLFAIGTTIVGENSTQRMQVTQTAELEGVYNCNNGYCVFEYINNLYENEEYAIVEKDNSYSLSNFDHIILNPALVDEDDIIY